MSAEPEFRALNQEEALFVETATRVGYRICEYYLDTGDAPSLPDALDSVYDAWISDENSPKPASNDIGFGLGALMGQCLVSDLGFQWVIVSDDSGTDYCVRHPNDWQSYPFDFVAKRIHEQEPRGGFFRALYDLLKKREVA